MKKLTVILLIIMLVFSAVPTYAANDGKFDVQKNIIYQNEITVTENGGVYQVGFVTLKFPKDFVDEFPVTINVQISAVDGVASIEFTPDMPDFNKNVSIIVHSYNGLLYDETLGKNIEVRIKQQKLIVEHFSRYAFS